MSINTNTIPTGAITGTIKKAKLILETDEGTFEVQTAKFEISFDYDQVWGSHSIITSFSMETKEPMVFKKKEPVVKTTKVTMNLGGKDYEGTLTEVAKHEPPASESVKKDSKSDSAAVRNIDDFIARHNHYFRLY